MDKIIAKKKNPLDFVTYNEGDAHADITLSRPAEMSGAKVGTIRMREPSSGDLENFQIAPGHEATRELNTFANLCEQSPADIRKLPLRDYQRLQAAYSLFTD